MRQTTCPHPDDVVEDFWVRTTWDQQEAGGVAAVDDPTETTWLDAAAFAAVSLYLFFALAFLIVTRRLPRQLSIRKLCAQAMRRKASGQLTQIEHQSGHCFVAALNAQLMSDADGFSRVVVCENGKPLPRPHALHDEIRMTGGGSYSHWSNHIFFSTSDNSDPRDNGRQYTFSERS